MKSVKSYLLGVAPTIVSLILIIIIKTNSFEINDEKLITEQNENNEEDKLVDRFTTFSQKSENE